MLLKLLTFPISGPLWVAGVVLEEAERRLYDEEAIRGEMAELARAFEAGEIDGDAFERQEEALLQRLMDARKYRRRKQEGLGA